MSLGRCGMKKKLRMKRIDAILPLMPADFS